MQIKGVNFARSGLGFRLSPAEVRRANKRLGVELPDTIDNYRASMDRVTSEYPQLTEQFGGLSVPYTRVNCDSSYSPNKPYPNTNNRRSYLSPNNTYDVEVSFRPSVHLTMELIDSVVDAANKATGLGFNPTEDRFFVTPSGLVYFKEPWSYRERPGRYPEQHIVRVKFFGLPNESQLSKLREISDDVYLPQRQKGHGRDYFYTELDRHGIFGSFGLGQHYPVVAIDKEFHDDFAKGSEAEAAEFYRRVHDFVLNSELSKNCTAIDGELLSTDSGLGKSTAPSNLAEGDKFAPEIGILVIRPQIIGKSGYGDYSMVVRTDNGFGF